MTGAVMIDFEAAFDRLSHPLVVDKIRELGVDGKLLDWFRSYFKNRVALVRNGDTATDFQCVRAGTPQGSAISGLIFSIYINDLKKIIKCHLICYADDACLYAHGKTTQEIQAILQENLNLVNSWASQVGMKISTTKTKSIIFIPLRCNTTDKLQISLDNNLVEQVDEFKYLGVVIDKKLTFTTHFNNVCKQMTCRMYMINRYKRYFSQKWIKIFCTSLILSKLEYCLPVWGNLCKSKYERVDKIMLRLSDLVILQKHSKTRHFYNVLEKLNWLTIAERYELYSLKFVYKYIKGVNLIAPHFSCKCFEVLN